MKKSCLIFFLISFFIIFTRNAVSEQPKSLNEVIESYQSVKLSSLADAAFTTLVDFPSRGISKSQQDVVLLIKLRDRLFAEESLPHQILGLEIQRGVDLALFTELIRSELDEKTGVSWGGGFDESTYDIKILEELLGRNNLPEKVLYEKFISSGSGDIALYFKENEVTSDDFYSGKIFQKLSEEFKTKVISLSSNVKPKKLNRGDMSDMLFVKMLKTSDEARDIRHVCQVYFEDGELPLDSSILRAKLEENLDKESRLRALTGNRNRSIEVASIMSRIIGNDPDQYNFLLSYYFAPFLGTSIKLPNNSSFETFWEARGIWLKPSETF